ncbi:unnamed protein product [Chilo suppressalis]|uniref:Uncharacterized protein n=1 Tax=Chilo suppressalis TaxID=168631 RepID=A0ABN8AYJ2_CHISP|nr:unnamed protein product [Chilo suppressalis]
MLVAFLFLILNAALLIWSLQPLPYIYHHLKKGYHINSYIIMDITNFSSSSSADIWKFLGTLGIGKSQHLDLSNSINLNDLNRHTATYQKLDRLFAACTVASINGLTHPNVDAFYFSPVKSAEIKKGIKRRHTKPNQDCKEGFQRL